MHLGKGEDLYTEFGLRGIENSTKIDNIANIRAIELGTGA
jgi:hypothetical protein